MIDNFILFGFGLLIVSICVVIGDYFFGDEE
jgi:hypothetical protein